RGDSCNRILGCGWFDGRDRARCGRPFGLPLRSFARLASYCYCLTSCTDAPVVPPSDVAKLYVMFAGFGAAAPAIDLESYLIWITEVPAAGIVNAAPDAPLLGDPFDSAPHDAVRSFADWLWNRGAVAPGGID